ncbi:MAG TPA: leucine-rich repeat protein [Clostridiales bacterium]|nr:leucine-rich repeat protein [Clostridiales bacterium]
MKKRVLSLALCLVLVVGLFSGLTVNASASRLDDLKKEIAEKLIKEKIEQLKEEFEIPDLDTDAILSSFATAATSGDFGENNCLHWEVSTGVFSGKTLTISGTGAMPDFDFPNGNLAPWWNYDALGMLTSFGNFKLEGELKKVVIKDGVTNVGDYALFFLPAATQVTLPGSVTRIGRYGIAMCSKLTGMSIPKGVTEIGDFGLAGDGLTAVTLPDGLQSLGRGAFDTCASLTNTTLPAAITAVPGKCFADCTKLLNVKYAGTVTAIGDLAFESCKALTEAPIPETVTEIGASAFTGCTALTDVTIPAGVTAIPEDCFHGCTALADMKLPGTVTSVGHNAFTGCTALKDVRCYGAAPAVEPGNSEAHSFEPAIVTIHYNPDPVYGWTLDADGKWQGYTVSSKGACLHTGYGTTENTVPATCGEAGRVDTICSNCGEVVSTKEIPATGAHTWDNGTVTTEPTETTPGVRTFTCAVCGATRTETIPATGEHTFVFTKNIAPTCTTEGYDLYTCSGCGATEKRNSKPALGHKWDNGTVTTEPTETTPGVRTYTCTVCGETRTETIPATGAHTHVWDNGTVTTEPTETTPGVRTYTCTVCGETRTETIPATGAHTHVWDNGTVTIAPTETTPGVRTYTCTVCGQTKNEIIPATGGSSVCPGGPSCPSYGFSDVAGPNDWSHEGIDYCVRRSLMVGTGAGTFSPGMNCSRAQIVQILYNLSGDKTDYSRYYLPFTDVAPGAWYYDAVAWAYFNNVVSGTSATTFAPNDVITREQMAVILYGYTAEFAPEFTGNAASLNTFPDAGSVANWAYAAMSWAVGNGLISGMGSGGVSYLAPQGSATRAQASAIIMRYCQLIGQ